MSGFPFLQSSAAVPNPLDTIFSIIENSADPSCCPTYLDISSQIPFWVVIEKEERGGDVLTIFDFIQKYYDWLYCEESCSGAGYILENKLLDIIDVERTRDVYRKRLYSTYFPEYKDTEILLDSSSAKISDESIGNFVKAIKLKFYNKKGSLESLKLFFKGLFSYPSIDESEVIIRYPKKQILRLNGGAFHSDRFPQAFNGSTYDQSLELENIENEIIGSYLNHNITQDGSLHTDYSYVINSGLTNGSYIPLFKRLVHPAGLNLFSEIDLLNYEPPGSTFIDEGEICQILVSMENYFLYELGTIYKEEGYFLRSNSGISYYGITYTDGCTGSPAAPCHFFPSWSLGIESYSKFFDIPINAMFALCRINTNINPNISIPDCT